MAVSCGCCNEDLVEGLGWILPGEGFPWSAVEFAGDGVEFVLAELAEVGLAFGEVLAQQSVGRSYVCQTIADASSTRTAASILR